MGDTTLGARCAFYKRTTDCAVGQPGTAARSKKGGPTPNSAGQLECRRVRSGAKAPIPPTTQTVAAGGLAE